MRTTKGAVITLLLAVMLLATRQLVLGQSEVPTPESPIVDEMAQGTRVPGTLTIYYEPTTSCPIDLGGAAKLFFIRLQHGKDLIALSGDLSGQDDICLVGDNSKQKDAIRGFIEENLQKIFPDNPSACCVALKSVDQFVLGVDDPNTPMIEPLFVMIDVVITVKKK